MPADNNKIRVVIFEEDNVWVAQCLEYDIGAQAVDLQSLEQNLNLTLMLEFEESVRMHGKPFQGIDKAPQQYFDMWEKFSRNQFVPENNGGSDYTLQRALCA